MKKIFLGVILCGTMGCASARMTATSTCTFSPSVKEGYYTTWLNPGDAKCTFTLNAPIDKAEDTKIFADAFQKVMGNAPQIVVDKK